ncbi:MAG: hypothetical protein ABII18_13090 [bacterium]
MIFFINNNLISMRTSLKYIFFFFLFLLPFFAQSYPITEKAPASASAPLSFLSAQPDRLYIPQTGTFQDEYLFSMTTDSTSFLLIDLDTWASHATQPDAFTASVSDVALLPDGTTLIVGLSDGDIATLELDDEDSFENTDETTSSDDDEDEEDTEDHDSRQTNLSENMTSAGISFMVADPDDDIIYMINSSGYFMQYNFSTKVFSEFAIEDSSTATTNDDGSTTAGAYTPTDMVYAEASNGDKILISTATGNIISISPTEAAYTITTLSSTATAYTTANPTFNDMALTPDHDYAFIVDSDNNLVWVFSLISSSFVDQQSSGTSLDPIEMADNDDNTGFTHIAILEDGNNDVLAYVSGETGLTVIDANNPDDASSTTKVIDVETTETDEDPIILSGTPGPLATTSSDTQYLLSANGDATISVLTENPWISITSISTEELVTETASTFTLTFQADIAGSYTIKANSNPLGTTGTALITATTFTDIDTDITTAEIDVSNFDRTAFVEGINKIFVHVTDDEGRLGHTAIELTIDRPPEAVTITGVNFGNQKVFVTFTPSSDDDIAKYLLYAEEAENQTDPTCPGALTFTTNGTAKKINPANCSEDSCVGEITSLTNDTIYCIAALAEDNAEQQSPLSGFSTPIAPEQTVGPAGFLGETSCSLGTKTQGNNFSLLVLLFLPLLSFFVVRRALCVVRSKHFIIFFSLLTISLAWAQGVQAQEKTPQNWTLEPKIYTWFPTDSAMRDFVGLFPHAGGEVEFGYLLKNRFNFTVTGGFSYEGGNAIGLRSGGASGDSYALYLFPVRFDFIFRFDFKSDQLFLPYLRAGGDLVFFHERGTGNNITNYKFGFHGGAGIGVLLDRIEQLGHNLETVIGVNDIYFTFEVRYAYLNSFSTTGLDLSGFYPYMGVLFEF